VSGKRDYYAVLNVPRDADPGAIKLAFRKAVLQFHPDRNPGDKKAEESFKEAAEAYEVLGDATKRQLYDRVGHESVRHGPADYDEGFHPQDILDHFQTLIDRILGVKGPFSTHDIMVQLSFVEAQRIYNPDFGTLSLSYERSILGVATQSTLPVFLRPLRKGYHRYGRLGHENRGSLILVIS
jgi:molecular chaperone DnaJ